MFGYVVAGGEDVCPCISYVRPESAAGRSDQLAPGDLVRTVNGISTTRMRPAQLSSLLDNVIGDTVTLHLHYSLPQYSSQSSLSLQTKVTTVSVDRVDGFLGITVRGGASSGAGEPQAPSTTVKPLVVTHVRPGGPAHRSGRIKVGDRLLKVDQHSLANATLLDAHQLLTSHSPGACRAALGGVTGSTSLTIEYDVRVLEGVRCASGPLLVEVERTPGEQLGLVLGPGNPPVDDVVPAGVYVETVVPASLADRCGALHAGDKIIALDGTNIEESSTTSQEVTWLLQNYDTAQGCTRLQIMPVNAVFTGHPNATSHCIQTSGSSSPNIRKLSTVSRRNHCTNRCRTLSSSTAPRVPRLPPAGLAAASCHLEIRTVALKSAPHTGYGLAVNADEDGGTHNNIVITAVEMNSPAYTCGSLQISDRLISLNGQCSLTLQEVRAVLELGRSNPGSRLLLQTEFDVADTVVPTSGVCTVNIPRTGPDLGITINGSKTILDDPLIISDIRRGSLAHRTGRLHVGDHVLAIYNRPLDLLTLDEVLDDLHNSQTHNVTLRIQKKAESLGQLLILEPPEEIIYTVTLNRRGGPLGITISGSETRTEPIIISALTRGGLAEKTGALHIGDRILAINCENLEQKSLSDAIKLLKTSSNNIQIKVVRQTKTNNEDGHVNIRDKYSSPGLGSIDSAVESWDSGVLDIPNDLSQGVASLDTMSKHLDTNLPSPRPPLSFSSFSCDQLTDQHLHQHHLQEHEQPLHIQNLGNYKESVTFEGSNNNNNNNNKKLMESQLLFYSDVEDSLCSSFLPLPNYNFSNNKYSLDLDTTSTCGSSVSDMEIHYVTLHKDGVYDDYGFSVSDGLYEKGVYINRIRRGGSAHLAGVLAPYDRIIQVNDTITKDLDCCLTVPLIASAGDKIELVIARNPFIGCPDEKDMHESSWTSYGQDLGRITATTFTSSQNTITKKL